MLAVLVPLVALLLLRACYVYWQHRRPQLRTVRKSCSVAVFLGSGGHTTEALQLLAALDRARYTPRVYIISQGDTLSAQRAAAFEGSDPATILEIPRARAVHQPLLTVPRTFILSLLHTLRTLRTVPCDLLLLNGPGTCVVLCVAVWLARFLGVRKTPRIVYVESFARVRSLSLSARIVAPLVDRLVVQWPQLTGRSRFAEYRGWLI